MKNDCKCDSSFKWTPRRDVKSDGNDAVHNHMQIGDLAYSVT